MLRKSLQVNIRRARVEIGLTQGTQKRRQTRTGASISWAPVGCANRAICPLAGGTSVASGHGPGWKVIETFFRYR